MQLKKHKSKKVKIIEILSQSIAYCVFVVIFLFAFFCMSILKYPPHQDLHPYNTQVNCKCYPVSEIADGAGLGKSQKESTWIR